MATTLKEVPTDVADVDSLTGPPRTSPLRVFVSEQDGRIHVDLEGELDNATAPLFQEQLLGVAADRDIVLDIGLLTFVDSTGLSLFVTLHKRLESQGRTLVLLAPTPMARRLFQITGLYDILRIEPVHP
jgi:stage II sporulation protein AA (anti-sigma F factor antagonist)